MHPTVQTLVGGSMGSDPIGSALKKWNGIYLLADHTKFTEPSPPLVDAVTPSVGDTVGGTYTSSGASRPSEGTTGGKTVLTCAGAQWLQSSLAASNFGFMHKADGFAFFTVARCTGGTSVEIIWDNHDQNTTKVGTSLWFQKSTNTVQWHVVGDSGAIFSVALPMSTTIAAGSNGQSLPQGTINVLDTSLFPSAGVAHVTTSGGVQIVVYTGKTSTSFTGCTGGTGSMTTGSAVGALGNMMIIEGWWSQAAGYSLRVNGGAPLTGVAGTASTADPNGSLAFGSIKSHSAEFLTGELQVPLLALKGSPTLGLPSVAEMSAIRTRLAA